MSAVLHNICKHPRLFRLEYDTINMGPVMSQIHLLQPGEAKKVPTRGLYYLALYADYWRPEMFSSTPWIEWVNDNQ